MAANHDRVAVVRGGEGVRKQVLGAKPQLLGGKRHAAVLGPAPDRAADRLVTLVAGDVVDLRRSIREGAPRRPRGLMP
jgi:hypothetical protein